MGLENQGNNGMIPDIGEAAKIGSTVSTIKGKVFPLVIAPISKISFRRRMFQSIFDKNINKLLDDVCLDFIMQTTGWFDEIILIKTSNNLFQPIYDYSLRSKDESPVELGEFEELVKIGHNLAVGDWKYIYEAEGSAFDMVGKVSGDYIICVNNTNASIDELEEKYPNRIFEEVKPVIERTIAILRDIVSNEKRVS